MFETIPPKKILLVSPFFYPEPISTGKYNTFLTQKLAEKHHDVTVICSYPFYPAWRPEFTTKGLHGVTVLRGGLRVSYPRSAVVRRLVLEVWFAWHFWWQALRLKGPVDVVAAVSPPVVFTFLVNALFKASQKVVIVHDLQGIMATSSNNLLRRLVASIMKQVEAPLLRSFDTVVCLSESMKDMLVTQYRIRAAACQVHYPFATLGDGPSEQTLLKDIFPAGFHHIVYSGAMGEKQKPRKLYWFFERLCKEISDICCHIFSSGPIVDDLRTGNRDKRICFHDLVPESHLAELYAHSDIQMVPQAEGTGAGAFPSKLPNLLAAGVPMLVVCDQESELARIIRETDAGKAVPSWDFQELSQAVDSLLEHAAKEPRAHRRAMAERHIQKKFDVNRLVASITQAHRLLP